MTRVDGECPFEVGLCSLNRCEAAWVILGVARRGAGLMVSKGEMEPGFGPLRIRLRRTVEDRDRVVNRALLEPAPRREEDLHSLAVQTLVGESLLFAREAQGVDTRCQGAEHAQGHGRRCRRSKRFAAGAPKPANPAPGGPDREVAS